MACRCKNGANCECNHDKAVIDAFQEMVVRTFVKRRTVYSLRAFHVTAVTPEESAANWRACYDWLNSWRPLDPQEAR